jgi:hypothetical protein
LVILSTAFAAHIALVVCAVIVISNLFHAHSVLVIQRVCHAFSFLSGLQEFPFFADGLYGFRWKPTNWAQLCSTWVMGTFAAPAAKRARGLALDATVTTVALPLYGVANGLSVQADGIRLVSTMPDGCRVRVYICACMSSTVIV